MAGRCGDLSQAMTSIETRTFWVVAFTALGIMSIAYGAPFIAVVALKPIAAELGSERTVPALAYSLAWLGAAWGGIAMGRVAERVGVRWTVAFGAVMIGLGLVVSAGGSTWRLWVGHGLFIGLLGNAGINAPSYIYVSRWFDRRRGTALALISSGQYVAGAIWPTVFERGIALFGWHDTMLVFAAVVVLTVAPLALLILRPPPEIPSAPLRRDERAGRVLGLPPNFVLALLAVAPAVLAQTGSSSAQTPAQKPDQKNDSSGDQQGPTETLKVNVKVVQLFFNVKDKKGALIPNLTKDDFEIFEDGEAPRVWAEAE